MAMLADPRRFRKKYNLVPRGKALFEDDNRFGTKMLERMGWTKGKGLGAREDGSQEFVRIRYKNDSNGIGYEDRDDQWTEHEKQFTGLLNSLHNSEANSEIEDEDPDTTRIGFGFESAKKTKENVSVKDKISGESLEEKSKKSKARVHYKKFTKGKDLSQYSEKDLANIFGKKTTDTTNFQIFEPIVVKEENVDDDDRKKFGITTINTGTSVTDYFKQKMEAIKNKRMKVLETNADLDCPVTILDKENKKKNKKKRHQDNLQGENLNSEIIETLEICKTKKLKQPQITELPVENLDELTENDFIEQPKKKKRNLEITVNNEENLVDRTEKKRKKKENFLENTANEENLMELTAEKPKKKKRHLETPVNEEKPIENLEESIKQKPRKKKRKENSAKTETNAPENFEDITKESCKRKKQNTKNLPNYEEVENVEEIIMSVSNDEKKKTKSEKKKKKAELVPDNDDTPEKFILDNDDIPEKPVSDQTANSVYIISEFCAEKFRHTDLNRFPGSNLSEIIGYGLKNDMKMKIVQSSTDTENITNLWGNVHNSYLTDKYKLMCPLRKYTQQVREAKRDKKKLPKLNIKKFTKKSMFISI